jgi:aminoglycoside phosphotransferase family enzyme/predicted kinase
MEPEQAEVMAFLARPESYPWAASDIECLKTHGAVVFLAGDYAIKVKRAVRYPYMDFSTLERRHRVLEWELTINRPNAPEIYIDVCPITREPNRSLAFAGKGPPVEWVLRMRRFDQSALLAHIAQQGPLDRKLAEAIADMVAASHQAAQPVRNVDGPGRLQRDARQIDAACAEVRFQHIAEQAHGLAAGIRQFVERSAPILSLRAADGLIRRCHGDLHLGNIVLWQNEPVLFDAIEFDDDIATVDVLYDLAFLLMDLERSDQRPAANAILGRYLWRTRRTSDLDALVALPPMLALRAGIRAIVALQRCEGSFDASNPELADVHRYLDDADRYIKPPLPRLIAIGGLSGTGKSTLAAALAPLVGAAPGALHLRSDLERKAAAGLEPTERLPQTTYSPQAAAAVYAAIAVQAERALRAGHSVIVDAVYARQSEREAIGAVAHRVGVPFSGIWLEAPVATLQARVCARTGDASDATPEVVRAQTSYETGEITWHRLPADSDAPQVLAAARALLSILG